MQNRYLIAIAQPNFQQNTLFPPYSPFVWSGVSSQNYITPLAFKRFPRGYEGHHSSTTKVRSSQFSHNFFPLNCNDTEHFFLLCPQWQLTSETALQPTLSPAFPAAIATMPVNVPLPLPTDQLNCRVQQQQTTQMHSSIVYALSFSHSILSRLNSTPSTFTTAVADKSTQP